MMVHKADTHMHVEIEITRIRVPTGLFQWVSYSMFYYSIEHHNII